MEGVVNQVEGHVGAAPARPASELDHVYDHACDDLFLQFLSRGGESGG